MCTTSIVRFRFSLKDNSETLDIDLSDKSIESESQYLSNIRSIRSTLGVKAKNQLITENINNMNNRLSNGHQLNDSNKIDSNLNNNLEDIHSITATTTTTSTSSSTVSSGVSASARSDPAMGLLSASSKDSLTQHLLSSLKSGKPENGQRIDFTNISWTDLKQTNSNKSNDSTAPTAPSAPNQTNSENELESNNLAQSSPLNDQTVDQMIEEVLNKSESQVSAELTAEPILETNPSEDRQQNESSLAPEIGNDSNTRTRSECSESRTCLPQSEPIDVKEQQMSLCRQTERLMRRIRRLQFRQTHRHLTQQMKAFVRNRQMVLGVGCQRHIELNASAVTQMHTNPVEDRMKLLTPEGVKGLSTSALVNLVKRLGNEANHFHDYYPQQTPVRPQPKTPPFTPSPQSLGVSSQVPQTSTTPTLQLANCTEESSLVKLLQKNQSQSSSQSQPLPQPLPQPQQSRVSREEKEAVITTLDTLSANLRHFETCFDSDATESSSGGESCDEFEDYDQDSGPQHSTPIQSTGHLFPMRKRSCWKWCVERAAIASRWTWLQAQVADLEFRIRQQNEMYRQLRATKGLISFGTPDHNLTVPTVPTSIVTKATPLSSATTSGSQPPPAPNLTESSTSIAPQSAQNSNSDSDSHNCMRTLPLNSMRKRKLVRSMSALSGATRKAAKYSTIQCSCNGLPDIVWPCVLCNGRYSYVHVIDTDCMPHFERVSLLDSSCHPVLSLNNDVSLGLHITELLKRETIQRPIPSRHQNKKRKSPPSPTLIANKFIYDSTKPKSPKRSQSVISSTKLRKKYDGSTKRKYVRRSGVTSDGVWRKRGRPRERVSSGSSRTESPIPSPVPSEGSCCGNSLSAPLHRRRRSEQNAFDINNIVIPYSIAATTRVEKLQYKEIITPKWRLTDAFEQSFRFSDFNIKSEINLDVKAVETQEPNAVDEDEDISDIAFTLRHAKCEEEERKRILAFMKGNTKSAGSMRGRGARVRFDSTRSDTNTSAGDGLFQNNDSTSQDSYTGASGPVVQNCNNESNVVETPPPVTERRRNASLSSRRDDSLDENFEIVSPFELRAFPLNDLDFDLMSKDSQPLCVIEDQIDSINDPEKSNEGTITANNSRAPTPVDSDGAESVVEHNEVDNDEDPEWEPKK